MEVIKLTKETNINKNFAKEKFKKKPPIEQYFGKLKWKGDALAEQRKLRDEWN